jgi:hypothetical protein
MSLINHFPQNPNYQPLLICLLLFLLSVINCPLVWIRICLLGLQRFNSVQRNFKSACLSFISIERRVISMNICAWCRKKKQVQRNQTDWRLICIEGENHLYRKIGFLWMFFVVSSSNERRCEKLLLEMDCLEEGKGWRRIFMGRRVSEAIIDGFGPSNRRQDLN